MTSLGRALLLLIVLGVAAPARARAQQHAARATHRIVHVARAHPAPKREPILLKAALLDRAPTGLTLVFKQPLPGRAVNSHFGLRQLSFEPAARLHDGVDIAAPSGEPIRATAVGFVRRRGLSESYGNFVELVHAGGLSSFYAHMAKGSKLSPGALVMPGAVLGFVGSTGHSTGPHLHFEVRRDGAPINPLLFMGRSFAQIADLPATPAPPAVRAHASTKAWRTWAALHTAHMGANRG